MSLPPALHDNPFEMPVFYRNWLDILGPDRGIRQFSQDGILEHRERKLKNLLSIRELRFPGWDMVWFHDFDTPKLEAFREVHRANPWDCLRLVWNTEREHLQQFKALPDLGYQPVQALVPPHYVVDLSQGWESYLRGRSRNVRQNLKTARRLAAKFSPERRIVTAEEEFEPFLELFFQHHCRYWQGKVGRSYFADPHERRFLKAWTAQLRADNQLLLEAFLLNGEIANLGISIRVKDNLFALFSINTGVHLDCSPGIISLYDRLWAAQQNGVQTVYLGFGNQYYKMQAASRTVERRELLLANPRSFIGRLYTPYLEKRLRQFTEMKAYHPAKN